MIAVAEFFFILVCNWMEMIPSESNEHYHFLPAPTADTNLTYAMAVVGDARCLDLRHPAERRSRLLQPLRDSPTGSCSR